MAYTVFLFTITAGQTFLIKTYLGGLDFKGLRLRVFLNRIESDSIKIVHKNVRFISIKKYFNNRPGSLELIITD